jgi:hypothetical protein
LKLLYDKNDLPDSTRLRDARFTWLNDLGVEEMSGLPLDVAGFLFGYENGATRYEQLVGDRPNVRDRPDERQELIFLPRILNRIEQGGIDIPMPRTWVIGVDESPADDLEFPLFVRTPKSSWKRGGTQARVRNLKELEDEMALLRRTFGWDTPILARKWIDVAAAGKWIFGNAPQEIRVWIVDHRPAAWSFHYLHVVPAPEGFPPRPSDLSMISGWAAQIGSVFKSRLICADFIRDRKGHWHFLEAGPGAVCGTAHESVFKFVAKSLRGDAAVVEGDAVGGPL